MKWKRARTKCYIKRARSSNNKKTRGTSQKRIWKHPQDAYIRTQAIVPKFPWRIFNWVVSIPFCILFCRVYVYLLFLLRFIFIVKPVWITNTNKKRLPNSLIFSVKPEIPQIQPFGLIHNTYNIHKYKYIIYIMYI